MFYPANCNPGEEQYTCPYLPERSRSIICVRERAYCGIGKVWRPYQTTFKRITFSVYWFCLPWPLIPFTVTVHQIVKRIRTIVLVQTLGREIWRSFPPTARTQRMLEPWMKCQNRQGMELRYGKSFAERSSSKNHTFGEEVLRSIPLHVRLFWPSKKQ